MKYIFQETLKDALSNLSAGKDELNQLAKLVTDAHSESADVSSDQLSELLEKEMKLMDQMVNEAAAKIQART